MTDNEEVERIEEYIRQHPNQFQHPLSENEIFENISESEKRIGLRDNNNVHRYLFDLFNLEHGSRHRKTFENEVLIQKVKAKITNLLAKVWFPDKFILLDTEQFHHIPLKYANIINILTKVVQRQNPFLDHLMEDDGNIDMNVMAHFQAQLDSLSIKVDIIDGKVNTLDEQVFAGDVNSTASDSGQQLPPIHDDDNTRKIICDTISKFRYMNNLHPTVLDIRRQLKEDYAIEVSVTQLNSILYSMKDDNILEMYQIDPASKPYWGIFSCLSII
jgi:hypothetical protein